MTTPNFFIIGAPKCGTTSLARYLAQHPSVYMSPIKEPCFFAPEAVDYDDRARRVFEADAVALRRYLDGPVLVDRPNGIVLDWADYLALFRQVTRESAVGEASVSYLSSAEAPARIRERIPDARLIAVLRDPADRLFSHYVAARASGATSESFARWVDAQQQLEQQRTPRAGPLWAGCYGTHLDRWFQVFSPAQFSVHLYEDFAREAQRVVSDIFQFLGVLPRQVDTSVRHNVTTEPRWAALQPVVRRASALLSPVLPRTAAATARWFRRPVHMRPTRAERVLGIEIYDTEIRHTAALLGLDLSHWLDADAPTHERDHAVVTPGS